MRLIALAAALAVLASPAIAAPKAKPAKPAPAAKAAPAAKQDTWFVICFGQDAQYTQVIGGAGFFHEGNGDRTYQTQKLLQSFYDGNTVCSIADPKAPQSSSGIAEVCVDRAAKTLSVLYTSDTNTKRVIPKNASPYCRAHIDVVTE